MEVSGLLASVASYRSCDRLGPQAEQGIGAVPQHAAILVHLVAASVLRSRERLAVGRPTILVVGEPGVRLLLVVAVGVQVALLPLVQGVRAEVVVRTGQLWIDEVSQLGTSRLDGVLLLLPAAAVFQEERLQLPGIVDGGIGRLLSHIRVVCFRTHQGVASGPEQDIH